MSSSSPAETPPEKARRPLRPLLLRAATIAVFVVVALLVARLPFAAHHPRATEAVEATGAGTSVAAVIAGAQSEDVVAVHGFLFDGGGTGLRLCYRRRPTHPPLCLGPFLDLYQLDTRELTFKSGRALGRPIRWVEQPVTLYGTVRGTGMTVTYVAG